MGISVKLQVFEGPLDLLLHLIDKNKVNIYDIPIAMITEQYMEYVEQLKKEDLNVVSEFLVMAATLLDIKSRMLLPKEVDEEGNEEDPRAELVEKLLEYKLYKAMAQELKDKHTDAERTYYKKQSIPEAVAAYTPPVDLTEVIGDTTLMRLNRIFADVCKRKEDKIDPVRSKFGKIEKEEVTMSEKLVDIKAFMMEHESFSFRELLWNNPSKVAVIVTFLVVLELIKTGFVEVKQECPEDDIFIRVVRDPELIEDITEEYFGGLMYTSNLPEVDLIIRPSGEKRLSNFLLWQAAYAEFWYSDICWPDFTSKDMEQAIIDYQNRDRRFGRI